MKANSGRPTVAAVLIVVNEERNLRQCLLSLDWADEIVIVDSGSTDQTLEIARQYTERIFHRDFDDFSKQKNYVIGKAQTDWILSIDADEIVSAELKEQIQQVLKSPETHAGYNVIRENLIFHKRLRYGGQGPEKILRLFRRTQGHFEQPIHEHVVVDGTVGLLKGKLIHESIPRIEDYLRKFRLYTDFEARWLAAQQAKPTAYHLFMKPFLRFVYCYFLRLGFLDGFEGFLFHFLSSFYSFLKYAKLREIQKGLVQDAASPSSARKPLNV